MKPVREPHWHDRAVASAADAWLTEPRDTEAYRRLVQAIERRRAWLQPTLEQAGDVDDTPPPPADHGPELLDDLGSDRAPVRLGSGLPRDPRALLEQLRSDRHPQPDSERL